jgi:hypothetical protein
MHAPTNSSCSLTLQPAAGKTSGGGGAPPKNPRARAVGPPAAVSVSGSEVWPLPAASSRRLAVFTVLPLHSYRVYIPLLPDREQPQVLHQLLPRDDAAAPHQVAQLAALLADGLDARGARPAEVALLLGDERGQGAALRGRVGPRSAGGQQLLQALGARRLDGRVGLQRLRRLAVAGRGVAGRRGVCAAGGEQDLREARGKSGAPGALAHGLAD